MNGKSGIEIANGRVFFNGQSVPYELLQEYLYEEHYDEAPDDAYDVESWYDLIFAYRRDVKNYIRRNGIGEAESYCDVDYATSDDIAMERAINNMLAAAAA